MLRSLWRFPVPLAWHQSTGGHSDMSELPLGPQPLSSLWGRGMKKQGSWAKSRA